MLSRVSYGKWEFADSKETDAIQYGFVRNRIAHRELPSIKESTIKNQNTETKIMDEEKKGTNTMPNICTSITQTNNHQNSNMTTQATHMEHKTTESINFDEIKQNGAPYKCPFCIAHSYSFETWLQWTEHYYSLHFEQCFHFHINNEANNSKQQRKHIKNIFAKHILFDETYFGLIMQFFTPKQYIQSMSLVCRFHYLFPNKSEYNIQIMSRMIKTQFFDIKCCSVIPIENIYESIKKLHQFQLNVNLSQIMPFTKHANNSQTHLFRIYGDTTIKSILWQYDLLQMRNVLQICYPNYQKNLKPIKWNLSTKIFDIISQYNTDHISITLCPKLSTFTQQMKFIQWFVPFIKDNIKSPKNEIDSAELRYNVIESQLGKCSSLQELKQLERDVSQCIARINNTNNINEKKCEETENISDQDHQFDQFLLIGAILQRFAGKILSIDQTILNKIKQYENNFFILNQHIVTAKRKAYRHQLIEIRAVEVEISKMDLSVFEMDDAWLDQKKFFLSNLAKAIKQQKNELLKNFEEWQLDSIMEYVRYVYGDRLKFSQQTMEKFKLFKLDGSRLIDMNDSLLILSDINDEDTRKLLLRAIDELLDNYGAHKYCKTQICCICTVNEVNTTCIPCGHCCYCTECRKQCMQHYSTSKCPMCRTKIVKIVTIYKAGMYK